MFKPYKRLLHNQTKIKHLMFFKKFDPIVLLHCQGIINKNLVIIVKA